VAGFGGDSDQGFAAIHAGGSAPPGAAALVAAVSSGR
jgi:hypothetical protein